MLYSRWTVRVQFAALCGLVLFLYLGKQYSEGNDDRRMLPSQQNNKKYIPLNGRDPTNNSNGDHNNYALSTEGGSRHNLEKETKMQINDSRKSRKITLEPNAFEPEVNEDIQIVDSENPRIPHIMHFIFITGKNNEHRIPNEYESNVKSFLNFNPNWTFYFWSDTLARELIATRQPALLPTYDKYEQVIFKADALRYVLLYEFGGVYTDLDMTCFRPLDRATMKYSCILTPEPFEHSAILHKLPYFISPAYMMCRPQHPFFKQAIQYLPITANLTYVSEATGPRFLTKQFIVYNDIQPNEIFRTKPSPGGNSPYIYLGHLEETHDDAIYVANTQYFMNSLNPRVKLKIQSLCTKNSSQNIIFNRGCFQWKRRGNMKTRNQYSFTDHFWRRMHSVTESTPMMPVQSIIPQIKLYKSNLKI